jgi:hypothetical protein
LSEYGEKAGCAERLAEEKALAVTAAELGQAPRLLA